MPIASQSEATNHDRLTTATVVLGATWLELMPFDEGVAHLDSLAKYAVTFFRMSRSIRVRASSAVNQLISTCSSLTAFTPARPVKRPEASALPIGERLARDSH